MRWIVWVLLVFAAAVGLALLVRFNHGNVAILWPPYRIEVSANLAIAALLGLFFVLHLLLIGTSRALALPRRVRDYRARRQQEQAGVALRDSVLAFFEGRLGRVERFAKTAQSHPATAGPAALIAARSAQRLHELERRDRWLQDAATDPGTENALLMTRAELAVEDRRTHEALEIVERLTARGARHIGSLRTALSAYEQAERWDDVLRTLRLLEKRDASHSASLHRLRVKACGALLASRAGDAAAIREFWRSLRSDERAVAEIAAAAASALADAGATEDARKIVEHGLDVAFSEPLVNAYARLGGDAMPSLRDRLERLEGWRSRYGDEPSLLRALGRICAAEKLWGKSEEYLTRVIRLEPSAAAHVALGELYEALGRSDDAAQQYRTAARLAVG